MHGDDPEKGDARSAGGREEGERQGGRGVGETEEVGTNGWKERQKVQEGAEARKR